ncbi:MAG: ATP-binding protein [Actinomycetota bacterium]|nr:ATP-binding protein [Actinomycetota bacterium]
MNFVARHFTGTLLVVIVALGTLLLLAESSLRSDIEEQTRENLMREARLAVRALPRDSLNWQNAVMVLHEETGLRFTVIDSSGRVRAESDVAPQSVPGIENHSDRPEVQAALRDGIGSARRRSATVGQLDIYVAVRAGPGVVRVATALSRVDAIVSTTERSLFGAALLALVVAAALSLLAGRHLTQPITAITQAARAIAQGQPPRFPHSSIPDIEALIGAVRDMHEQLARRFEELRSERSESAALVAAMVEGVIATDARGRIITANPAARRLLGYGMSQPLPDLPQLFRTKQARDAVQAIIDGESVVERQIELDGAAVLLSGRPLPGGETLLVLHDVSELRRLETVRRDFVANVSHELKTPLTAIQGFAETLLGGALEDPKHSQRFLEIIREHAMRLGRLTDDLLKLSRIEAGKHEPQLHLVRVPSLVGSVVETSRFKAEPRNISLTVAIPEDIPPIESDADWLAEVLQNLIDNAIQYTSSGGAIRVWASTGEDEVSIGVTDNGIGIPLESQGRIFERFYRVDAARSREVGGTGLGLAIAKHLVESLGGRIELESEAGKGSTFTIVLPRQPQLHPRPVSVA